MRSRQLAIVIIVGYCVTCSDHASAQDVKHYLPPVGTVSETEIIDRKQAQQQESKQWAVRHDFKFHRRKLSDDLTWSHQIVDDAGKNYKAVHYDHGNGISVADVDNDGDLDIYLLSQVGPNALWKNDGRGNFVDVTEQAGVAVQDAISVAAAFADIDNDGDSDLYVTTVRFGNRMFENDGQGRFKDISIASGTNYNGHSSAATFFDFDNDGNLDLFVNNIGTYTTNRRGRSDYYVGLNDAFSGHLAENRTELSRLYRNIGGNQFVDVTSASKLVDPGWTGDAFPVDINNDGWVDLYTTNMQGLDRLWINEEGKTFRDETERYFPRTPWGAMGIQFFDIENDGDFDLAISDMHSDMTGNLPFDPKSERKPLDRKFPPTFLADFEKSIHGNVFFRNDGGTFDIDSESVGIETYWPWGISQGDLNADGYQDLFVTGSMNYPFRYGINSVLLNDNGRRFVHAEFVVGIEPRTNIDLYTDWFTLDCSNEDKSHTHCEDANTKSKLTVMGAIGSRSSVVFDIDQDGDLDIVTSEFNQPPIIWENTLADKTDIRYLTIALQGQASNRQGLGSVVRVKSNKMTQSQILSGKTGYMSQSDMSLYFAIPTDDQVVSIEVTWADGQMTRLSGPFKDGESLQIQQKIASESSQPKSKSP